MRLHPRLPALLCLVLSLHAAPTAQAATQPLPPLPAGIPTSAVSVWVAPVEPTSGTLRPRLEVYPDTLRQMASLMKLFTTGAALLQWGPAYAWRTELGLGGPIDAQGRLHGPLYWRASGDPSLDATRLLGLLNHLREAGLQHLDGDIVVDRSAFARPPHDPFAFDGEGWRPYNAGPDPLLIAHQSTTLNLRLGADGRWQGRLSPELAAVRLDLSGLTPDRQARACGAWRSRLQLTAQPEGAAPGAAVDSRTAVPPWVLRVSGTLPVACGETNWPLLWEGADPGDHAERVLRAQWVQWGGTWRGRLKDGTWPIDLPVWQHWDSPPLAEVVRDINKYSNNVMARQLMLSLPAVPGADVALARETLALQVRGTVSDCQPGTLSVDNGAGLSRTEGSTARCMGQWLAHLWRSPVMPEFMASLPVPGVDGTTRRWSGASAQAHVKTGSLDGVTGVAGYVLGNSGQRYIVVAVVNHPAAGQARSWLNAMLSWAQDDQDEATLAQRPR